MFFETGVLTTTLIFLLAIWSIAWKGIALWIAAREGKKYWFIAILVLNTVGILEIVYIFFFSAYGKKYISGWKKHLANRKLKKDSSKAPKEEEQV